MNQQEAAAYRIGVIVGACSVLIVMIVIGVFFYKLARPPYVPYIHLLVDYHFGFTKRALIGAMVSLFAAKVPVWLVFAISGAAWLITLALFVKLFRRTFGFDNAQMPLFVFMAGSPFFLKNFMHTLGHFDIYGCALAICLLLIPARSVAYVLLADRKIWAAVQMRRGPNVVGPWGLFQSFADLIKFALKEPIIPAGANKGVFLLAPLVTCVLALSAWAVIPVNADWVIADINVGILYVFAISSLGVYGIIMAGWASNSKYAFLSAIRSAAQMVSYEVSIGFVIITVLLCAGSL